jgi:hypothetical protein
VGGRGAGRQDPRHRRPRPHRQARGPAGAGVRHAPGGVRPVRVGRARPPDVGRAAAARELVAEPTSSRSTCPRRRRPSGSSARSCCKAKPGLRVVNVARGGIVDEEALAEAVREGHHRRRRARRVLQGAMTESPLFELDEVVVTPHLGASTREAQDKAGDTIAEHGAAGAGRRLRAVRGERQRGRGVRDGAPVPAAGRAAGRALRLAGRRPPSHVLEVEYEGQIAGYDTRILTLSC